MRNLPEPIVHAIANFRKEYRESIRFLFPIGLGVGIGILLFSRVMQELVAVAKSPVLYPFIGLVLGSIPALWVEGNRNGFRTSFIGAAVLTFGFALAAGPVQSQTVIRTSADGLDAGDLWIPSGAEKIPAYMAAPAKAGKYPVVIVVPEIFGMHEYQKDICRRLAKLGYVGITLDPFFRSGDLSKMTEIRTVVDIVERSNAASCTPRAASAQSQPTATSAAR